MRPVNDPYCSSGKLYVYYSDVAKRNFKEFCVITACGLVCSEEQTPSIFRKKFLMLRHALPPRCSYHVPEYTAS